MQAKFTHKELFSNWDDFLSHIEIIPVQYNFSQSQEEDEDLPIIIVGFINS